MHINLKTSFMNIVMVFLIFLVMFILTACSGSSEIDIESFKLYTAQSELESANEIKFEIELSGVGSHTINNFQITHGEEEVSCKAESIIGKNDVYYTTFENFSYKSGDKYYLTAIVYDTNKEVKFEKNTLNTCSMPVITNSVAKMELKSLNLNSYNAPAEEGYKLGDKLTIEVKITNGEKYQARYLAYNFTMFDGFKTLTKSAFLNKVYGSLDTYTINITLPTQDDINSLGALEFYNEANLNFSCKLNVDCIIYGAKNSELTTNVNANVDLVKDTFEIVKDTFQPYFIGNTATDVNNNRFATVGTQLKLVPTVQGGSDGVIKLKYNGNHADQIETQSFKLTINGDDYDVPFAHKGSNYFESFNINTIRLKSSDPRGIVISAIKYEDGYAKKTIDLTNREIVCENEIAYDYVVDEKEDLMIFNADGTPKTEGIINNIKDNTLTCNLIFINNITILSSEISRSIFNGSYNLNGRIEGNGKTLSLGASKPIFNEIHSSGRISNLTLTGQYTKSQSDNSIADGTQAGFDGLKATAIITKTNGGTLKNIYFNGNITATVNEDRPLFISLIEDNAYESEDILINTPNFTTNATKTKYLYYAFHNICHVSDSNYHTGEIKNVIFNLKDYESNTFLFQNYTDLDISSGSYINDDGANEYNLFAYIRNITTDQAKQFLIHNVSVNKNTYLNSEVKQALLELSAMINGNNQILTSEEYAMLTNTSAFQTYYEVSENETWLSVINSVTSIDVVLDKVNRAIKVNIEDRFINKMVYTNINATTLINSNFKTVDTGEVDAFWQFSQNGSNLTVNFRFQRKAN